MRFEHFGAVAGAPAVAVAELLGWYSLGLLCICFGPGRSYGSEHYQNSLGICPDVPGLTALAVEKSRPEYHLQHPPHHLQHSPRRLLHPLVFLRKQLFYCRRRAHWCVSTRYPDDIGTRAEIQSVQCAKVPLGGL